VLRIVTRLAPSATRHQRMRRVSDSYNHSEGVAGTDVSGTDNQRTGGEGGIRTPDTVSRIPVFKTGAFNRSATSPIIFFNMLPKFQGTLGNISAIIMPEVREKRGGFDATWLHFLARGKECMVSQV
jgi:hypothetical protein